jgi:Mg2+/citrate symporter
VTSLDVVAALVPSVGVGLLFWFAMRAIIGADRRERAAIARLERQADKTSDTE